MKQPRYRVLRIRYPDKTHYITDNKKDAIREAIYASVMLEETILVERQYKHRSRVIAVAIPDNCGNYECYAISKRLH